MKIAVVGAGNAGCFTALWFAWFGRKENVEVELIYNPEIPVAGNVLAVPVEF
jgi:protoporphyrinogen oxidase